MKKFIISVLTVTVFCVGLGAIVDKAGASLKSDEKAVALIKQARLAIGGEQSIAEVRSMIIKGNTTHNLKVNGTTRTEQGETEIAMQLPDKMSKMVKIGRHDGTEGEKMVSKQHDVIVMRGEGAGGEAGAKKFVIRKTEGGDAEVEKAIAEGKDGEFTTEDGKKIVVRKVDGAHAEDVIVRHGKGEGAAMHGNHRQNELLRTTLSLLLTAPEGMDVSYTYAGEGDVDGTACNIVNAEFAGSNVKLYLSKTSNFPVMISFQGHAMPRVMAFKTKSADTPEPGAEKVYFEHKIEAPEAAEVQLRFSDYRSTGGIQLPHKWTTTVAGQTAEVLDVTGYEINPANIAEKFQNQRTFVRTTKESN